MIEFMQHALETDNSAIFLSLFVCTMLTVVCVAPWGITDVNPADDPRNKKQ
jgi:hypothetical protein